MRRLLACSIAAIALAGCQPTPRNEPGLAGNAAADSAPTAFKVDKVPLAGEGRGDYLTIDAGANAFTSRTRRWCMCSISPRSRRCSRSRG